MGTQDQGGGDRQATADDFEGGFVGDDEQAPAAGEHQDAAGDDDSDAAGSGEPAVESGSQAGSEDAGSEEQDTADHGAGFDGEAAGSGEGDGAAGEEAGSDSGEGGDGEQAITAEDLLKDLAERFEKDPDKRTPERVLHQVRTWHGRLNTLREESQNKDQQLQEKDRQIEQLQQQLQQAQSGSAGSDSAGASGAEHGSAGDAGGAGKDQPSTEVTDEHRRLAREEIAIDNGGEVPAYVDDSDIDQRARHIAQRESVVAQRVTDQVRQELDSRVSPLETEHQESEAARHFDTIRKKHSDFSDVVDSDDFDLWRQEQPPRLQQTIDEVMESGTADDVIWMLDQYKQARGLSGSGTAGTGADDPAPGDGQGSASRPSSPSTPAAPPRQPSRPAAGPGRAAMGGGSFDEGFDRAG